jgi:hypothetical protein
MAAVSINVVILRRDMLLGVVRFVLVGTDIVDWLDCRMYGYEKIVKVLIIIIIIIINLIECLLKSICLDQL